MENFVEGGLTLTNYLTDKYFEHGYDKTANVLNRRRASKDSSQSASAPNDPSSSKRPSRDLNDPASASPSAAPGVSPRSAAAASTTSSALPPRLQPRRQRNRLPSPERDPSLAYPLSYPYPPRSTRSAATDNKSRTSDRVIRDYERESDDPKRKLESVLSAKDLQHLASARRDSATMPADQDYQSRPRSEQRGRGYYDDDGGDSDYDEHTGRRYRSAQGRGWGGVDERDRDDYDVVMEETERYRGPPANRPQDAYNRQDSYRTSYDGAVAPYDRRSRRGDDDYDERRTQVSRRSKSRARDERSRSYSGSRSRSREGGKHGIADAFDKSPRGIGVGIAGAVIGGLAGREFGHKHQKRDMLIGAIVGGLGANAAENKWREWRDEKREREEYDQRRDEQRY